LIGLCFAHPGAQSDWKAATEAYSDLNIQALTDIGWQAEHIGAAAAAAAAATSC
jgi:hypothetical protein